MKKFKHYVQMALVPILFGSPLPLLAGNLNSSAAPASTNSYTITDICNRLDSGTAGSQTPFSEPGAGPGATGCTLNDVMGKTPTINASGALPAEVLAGKVFWGLLGGNWGEQTGTMSIQTLSDTTTTVSAGNYAGADLVTVDTDLIAANIKSGVTIFGIAGTYTAGAVAVPKTGQTTCYDVAGATISCTGTGQDGDLLVGTTLPNPRFTDNSNGTVTDNLTGLIWLKNANCNNAMMPWANALSFANTLYDGSTSHNGGDCGLTDGSSAGDWRLPNKVELASLLSLEYFLPPLSNAAGSAKWSEGDAFTGVQSDFYWSSTTIARVTTEAWFVYLYDGGVSSGFKTIPYYVWPVRGGQQILLSNCKMDSLLKQTLAWGFIPKHFWQLLKT